jgi:hypothetical protein
MQRLRKPQVFDLMSLTAGTIMHRSHTPLIKWFWAIYMTAQDKRGVSAVRLQRELEVSYPTAYAAKNTERDGEQGFSVQTRRNGGT